MMDAQKLKYWAGNLSRIIKAPYDHMVYKRYIETGKEQSGQRICVVMTTFNSARFVEDAIRSVLSQSHENFHLVIVDDASDDNTIQVVKALAKGEHRISLYRGNINRGTYWAKNWALAHVKDPYVTFHDSDDKSMPDRLMLQLGAMTAENALACTVRWRRVDDTGETVIVDSKPARLAAITLMIDRQQALEKIGFFDSVRIAADTEYLGRIVALEGASAHLRLPNVAYEGWLRPGSLTTGVDSGVQWRMEGGFAQRKTVGARADYLKNAAAWHKSSVRRLDFPLSERPFEAPSQLMPDSGMNEMSDVEWLAGERIDR